MDYLVILLSGGSLIAAFAGILVWRLVKNYGKKEVLEDDMEEHADVFDALEVKRKAHDRLESDSTFAKLVRDRFTRRNK